MTDTSKKAQQLQALGIKTSGKVHWDLPTAQLYEETIRRGLGRISRYGALVVDTGEYTGRCPDGKYVVEEPTTKDQIAWGAVNRPMKQEQFNGFRDRIIAYLNQRDLFVEDCYAGADVSYRITARTISESPWHALFARTMFIREHDKAKIAAMVPDFTILHAPNMTIDPKKDNVTTNAIILVDFSQKLILIAGTRYAGEIKKSIFTVLNYLLPQKGVMPMHCSANYGATPNDTAVFFGLSGTGKTTLSADPSRTLIGDDEHGWSDHGVFNFEGGCYAKVIRLSEEGEPDIYRTTRMFGTVLENVVMHDDAHIDLNDGSKAENTRAAYPVSHIRNMSTDGTGKHPKNIIMLTADAFGILPPIAKLSRDQALYHFLSGYTAKVAGTEKGVKEPTATFSVCFGAPFMPLSPSRYAELLGKKIDEHKCDVWLVNTGWSGGPAIAGDGLKAGARMKLAYTRALVTAALNGSLAKAKFEADPIFGVQVPVAVDGVPSEILKPRNTWSDPALYDAKAKALAKMFQDNFAKKAPDAPASIRDAGPRA